VIVEKEETPEEKEEKEKLALKFETLDNFSRVTPGQEEFISIQQGSRYKPVKESFVGIVMLKDLKPGEPEVLMSASMFLLIRIER
jgi:hypothetical protein